MYDPYVGKKERGSRAEAAPPAAGRSLHADESTLAAEWPWSKDAGGEDFGDHFETPKRAYRDIKPVLRKEAQRREIEESALRLYDPYFCRGAMVTHLNSLGFANVINAKRDFYADIAADRVPAHDVLVTNPPYSGEHKAKLFAWLLEQHRAALKAGGDCRPFMLLLPAWTAKWLPWRTFLWAMARLRSGKLDTTIEDAMEKAKKLSNLSDQLEVNAEVFYLVNAGVFYLAPETKYEYEAAVAAREEAPFFGVWFCGGFPDNATREAAVAAIEKRASKEEKGTTACVIPTLRALVEAGHAEMVKE
ncbi:hypothetical protein T484DRAFT_1778638 [Baffinella frigidus]|nr:hypothetical protein T484DRAFT_1778638 [Cryptophyta sp. CCMP2293]